MRARDTAERRRIGSGAYVVFFLLFALILFLSHIPLLSLPYFWDEAGQFVPAGLDILHGGHWIPQSVKPNIHPPAVMAYLAAAWKLAGFTPVTTRCAMLLVAAFGVLAAFLLAIELARDADGRPAFLAAGLVLLSPLFFAQSIMAQLDAPAMLFTSLALLFFLQERLPLAVAASVILVLVKETGLVVPLVFLLWLARERRWRDALWFALPGFVLLVWIAVLARTTGNWAGNPDFEAYNLTYTARPARIALMFLRRVYYIVFANFHWLGAAAVLIAWRRTRIFATRSWRVAWLVVAAQVAMVSIVGGAVLERYLLPVMPIVYTAMAVALTVYRRAVRLACSTALLAGLAVANWINPPYPFPYENNLAFSDFIRLHQSAAAYLETWYPDARIQTAWPMTAELTNPKLGYVGHGYRPEMLPDMSRRTIESLDSSRVDVLVTFSRTWNPPRSWRLFGFVPNVTRDESRRLVRLPLAAHFERRGQWVDVYADPALRKRGVWASAGGSAQGDR
jgi:4-amino-4-deoxy-L-arabinose transferase-like glycosyltransferase